jgi:hypothetical protein
MGKEDFQKMFRAFARLGELDFFSGWRLGLIKQTGGIWANMEKLFPVWGKRFFRFAQRQGRQKRHFSALPCLVP